ncbi:MULTISPECIES: RagB/SusD family nutrient uptake outer membrane protein [Muribaculaceae]|uniref:RagB/SusD family nutrient uptake outer membrane protein n=1 Tax=Muribaculaceae TaxID=2005473 RepID=UPI0023B84901|nr:MULTISPECIES: RagB/SusD family nutrient uptake outer membrane protein [Muribaculaceae]
MKKMNFKKLLKYTLSGMAIIPMLSACNSDTDFLTEKPETIYTPENAYETVDQVKACVTNLYVHIRYWYDVDQFLKGLGSDVADTPNWRASGNGVCNFSNWSTSSNQSNKIFESMYQLVNYANQSLEGVNQPSLSWASEDERLECYGEMMFMRGYGYLRLGEMFGGVPLVTKFYQELKLDFERSSRSETYNQAISDLKEAAENLPDYPSEAGRVGKGAAYHFLSEAYLALAIENDNNASDLDMAISYADKVMALHPVMTECFGSRAIPGGGKAVNGVEAYREDGNVFFDLFQRGNQDYQDGNTEALWVFQHNYNIYHEYGGNKSESPRNWSPVLRDAFWKDEYKENGENCPWNGADTELYPGGNICAYVGGRGISANAPTNYVINEVWHGDFSDDMRNAPCNIHRDFVVIDKNHSMYGQVVTKDMLDPTRIDRYYPVWEKWASWDDYNYDDLSEGWQRSAYFIDQYACRSAETVLLRAEAKLRKGDKGGAADDVNILRNRAQCSYKAQASDMTMQFILDERVRELFFEEQRWPTLLRIGKEGIESINKHAMYIADQSEAWPGCFTSTLPGISKWTLFPIPQTIIDTNTGAVIEQNPGW